MAFSFSAPQPAATAQPAQTSSLFGNTNNTAAKPAFAFGQAGGSTTGQASTGLFGPTTGQQQQQQPQQQTGGLFGSTSAQTGQQQQQPTGGLFGSTNNQQTGQGQQTGGLFGSTTQQQQPQQQGTSLFGSQPQQGQQQQQGQTGQTSLFGGLGSTQKPGGLFGSGSTTTGAGTGTGTGTGGNLFGGFGSGQQQQQQPQQQGQSTSLFGGLGASQNKPGLFGSMAASTSQQPQQTQQNQLGQSQQQPQQQAQNPLARSTLFDSTTFRGSLFSQSSEKNIETKLGDVQNAYDPNHADYRFRCFFYNRVAPGTAGQYAKPNGVSDDEWTRAKREAPDADFVPVAASGWTDMEKRVAMQEAITAQHQNVIKQIQDKLAKLTRETSAQSSHRLITLQRRLIDMQHRILKLAAQTASIQPGSAGQLTSDELGMKATLEVVQAELEGRRIGNARAGGVYGITPLGSAAGRRKYGYGEGRMAASVNELYGAIEEIRRRKRLQGALGGEEGWLADERVLGQVAEILGTQQMALEKLQTVLKDGEGSVKIIDENLKGLYRA